ncbi:MAG: glutamine-hydrolyzing GMP synthase, partial [Clostridium sp.]
MQREIVLIVDFGGQYNQLIARRVRECGVYCEIIPYTWTLDKIKDKNPSGIIFTGGPNSVYGENTPKVAEGIFSLGIPVLGICYGAQLMSHSLGGKVETAPVREYGKTHINLDSTSKLLTGIEKTETCFMSHTDYISKAPAGFKITAFTDVCPVAAMEDEERKLYGVQFHPEVEHTPFGQKMLSNFLHGICGLGNLWSMASFAQDKINEIKKLCGDKKVLCALSGGVDSSVAAMIVHKAIGHNLTCIFVDHGLLRKDEGDTVERVFKQEFDMNIIRVNAQDRFLGKLYGVSDPEKKRKIIGEEFIRVFEEEA